MAFGIAIAVRLLLAIQSRIDRIMTWAATHDFARARRTSGSAAGRGRRSGRPDLKRWGKPHYLAIAEALAEDIRTGCLTAGTRLPAQRALAEALDLNFTTVSRGYVEAHKRGLIEGARRPGHLRGRSRPAAPSDRCRGRASDRSGRLHHEPAPGARRAGPAGAHASLVRGPVRRSHQPVALPGLRRHR